jgi:hypothetical protein
MHRFLRLRVIVLLVGLTSSIIERAQAGPETSGQNDSLRLRDLGTQRLTVGQISPVAQPAPSATPTPEPTLPSSQFNPDPGSGKEEIPIEPPILFPPVVPEPPEYGEEPLPRSLELPRKGVRESVPQRRKLEYETYPEAEEGEGVLPNSKVPIWRTETLASVPAKHAEGRCPADRSGHFSEPDRERFCSIRSAPIANAKWRE